MAYTISEGLRDREYAKFIAVQIGSISAIGVVLHAIQSGTTEAVPVLCDANGLLLTSGVN